MAKPHKLGREGRTAVLEALVVVSIITLVHFFFFRDLMLLAVVAITVSLLGARAGFRQSLSVTLRVCVVFAVASLVSLAVTFFVPETLWGYLIAVFIAALLSAVFTRGRYVALTLVMVNVMFFVVLPQGAGWGVRFVPLLVLAEALFGAAVTLLVTRVFFSKREAARPPERPAPAGEKTGLSREEKRALPPGKRIAWFFRHLDTRVYKAVIAAALGYLVYAALDRATGVPYPAFIFNATFLAAAGSQEQTLRSGKNMVLGLFVGIAVGFAAFLVFSALPGYYLAIPFVVVLVVFLDLLFFGKLEPGSVVVAFLLMVDMSGGHPYRFIVDRVALALVGIGIAVAVDVLFLAVGRKRKGAVG